MSDNTNTASAGENTTGNEGFKPINSQEDLDKLIGARVARERAKYEGFEELKAKASRFDDLQNKSKSDTERLQDQLNKIQSERDQEKLQNARLSAIAAEGIPAEYQEFVQGTDAESFASSAKKLKDLLAKNQPQKPGVTYKVNLDGDGSDDLALNGNGLEQALKSKLGIK